MGIEVLKRVSNLGKMIKHSFKMSRIGFDEFMNLFSPGNERSKACIKAIEGLIGSLLMD